MAGLSYRFVAFNGLDILISLLTVTPVISDPVPSLIVSTLAKIKARGGTLCLILVIPDGTFLCPFNPPSYTLPDNRMEIMEGLIDFAQGVSPGDNLTGRDSSALVVYDNSLNSVPLLSSEVYILFNSTEATLNHQLSFINQIFECGHYSLRADSNRIVIWEPQVFRFEILNSHGDFKPGVLPVALPGAMPYGPGFGPVPVIMPVITPQQPSPSSALESGLVLPLNLGDFSRCVGSIYKSLSPSELALIDFQIKAGGVRALEGFDYVQALEYITGHKLSLIQKLKLMQQAEAWAKVQPQDKLLFTQEIFCTACAHKDNGSPYPYTFGEGPKGFKYT